MQLQPLSLPEAEMLTEYHGVMIVFWQAGTSMTAEQAAQHHSCGTQAHEGMHQMQKCGDALMQAVLLT